MKDFDKNVYPEILEKLKLKNKYVTKTEIKPNIVRLEADKVFVKTEKSDPIYEEIPIEMFKKTWELIVKKRRVTQAELSKIHNIKRSAFMFIAFDLLEYVKYNSLDNSINLLKSKMN